jgi:SulP family sulfate permease
LILCGARSQPAWLMTQAEFHEHVGDENICPHIEAALERAARIHAAQAVA